LMMAFVYAGHLLSSLCGRYLVDRDKLVSGLPLGVIAASVGFYLVSNIGELLSKVVFQHLSQAAA
jgi:hypothetical protein